MTGDFQPLLDRIVMLENTIKVLTERVASLERHIANIEDHGSDWSREQVTALESKLYATRDDLRRSRD